MPHAHLDVSIHIEAPAEAVFHRMSDLARFNDWNPFPRMDPSTVSRHEGPAAGPGAIFHYEGRRLGRGRMEIETVFPPQRIDIAMTFWQGDSATPARSAFVVVGAGDTSEVHWTFDQDRGPGMHLMGRLMFDRMMANTFRSGLETLKSLVEAEHQAR